jgi:hypothetical protein
MTELVCCICLDDIISNKNVTTTECGHTFHCRCLMQNTAHNGYDCPYCRTIMADIPAATDDYEDEDEDEFEYDEDSYDDDNALTSFRMFHQRTSGDDIEEEPEITEPTEEIPTIPTAQYIAQILSRQGVTLEDTIKALLIEHDEYDDDTNIDRKNDELFGRMRIIISNYADEHNNTNTNN